jgi:hypothetical protein
MPKQEESKHVVFFDNPSLEILNFDDQIDTNTALHNAILERDHAKLARALEKADSKFITAISCGNSPLLLACKLADRKAAEMILQKMTQLEEEKAFPVNEAVNEKGLYGMTALHWASFYKFNELCEQLIYLMADDQAKTKDKKSVEYFYTHQFVPADFLVHGEITEGRFHLSVSSLSDIAFHADKIALNLNLTTPFIPLTSCMH